MAVNRMFRTCPSTGPRLPRAGREADPLERRRRRRVAARRRHPRAAGHARRAGRRCTCCRPTGSTWCSPRTGSTCSCSGSSSSRSRCCTSAPRRCCAAGWRRRAWRGPAFWLMIIGALMNNVAVFRGDSRVMFTSYAPMGAHPTFYLGLILFAVGALIACFVFFGTLVVGEGREDLQRLGAAGDLRRGDRGDHRGVHDRLRRDHPDPDLPVVGRAWSTTSTR